MKELLTVNGVEYKVLNVMENLSIADSFVNNDNKIGKGAGEAKLYIGGDNQELRKFYGKNFILNCFILKSDLVDFLNKLQDEYNAPTQEYRNKASMPKLWKNRLINVNNLQEINLFKFTEQTQIGGSRVYGKSTDTPYSFLRELSLPNYTLLNIYKLQDKDLSIIYYFKLILSPEYTKKVEKSHKKQDEEKDTTFSSIREDSVNEIKYNGEKFTISSNKLQLSENSVFDWGTINTNSMLLAQAILLEITHDENICFTLYDDFLREFLLTKKNKWELKSSEIKSWIKQKLESDSIIEDDNRTENSLESIYPYGFDIEFEELNIIDNPFTIKDLVEKLEEGKLITDPDFQRNIVWKEKQKCEFIESVLLNIPLPPIYLNQTRDGRYIIVDGLQRCTSLKEFLNFNKEKRIFEGHGFQLKNLRAIPQVNGLSLNDLSENLQTRIKDKKINCHIIKPNVPMKIVYDIFNRINTGGTELNRQEIRNCVFIGSSTILLSYLSSLDIFKKAIDYGVSSRRMKDKEVILRYLAFQIFNYKKYDGDMDEFLGEAMKKLNIIGVDNIPNFKTQDIFMKNDDKGFKTNIINNLINIDQIKNLVDDFEKVMKLSYDFFGVRNFRFPMYESRGRINIAILESVGYFFSQHDKDKLVKNKPTIQRNFKILLDDEDYQDAVRFSTGDKKRVIARFEKAIDILGENLC